MTVFQFMHFRHTLCLVQVNIYYCFVQISLTCDRMLNQLLHVPTKDYENWWKSNYWMQRYLYFGSGTDPISLLILFLLPGWPLQKSQPKTVHHFKSNRDEFFGRKLFFSQIWICDMTSYFQDGDHDVISNKNLSFHCLNSD